MVLKNWRTAALIALLLAAPIWGTAQQVPALGAIKTDQALTGAVRTLDKQLFDAYNTCDIDKLSTMVADDLEFYHDKTGLAVGKQPFLDSIKKNICGKVNRQLVPASLEVYPIHDYGAVEIGTHRFTHPGIKHDVLGEAKFVHLWQYKDGAWKVTRVISYDHNTLK